MYTSTHVMLLEYHLCSWTTAYTEQCSAKTPQLLSTGSIEDGQGQLLRLEIKDHLLSSWILTPGGQVGGFYEVTLIFTQFLLTSEDTGSVYSCFDINCMDLPTASTFKRNTVQAPLCRTCGVHTWNGDVCNKRWIYSIICRYAAGFY